MAIVSATIAMSRQLGLKIIAEGIEDAATAEALLAFGCDEGQGYHYGKPMPAEEFAQRCLTPAGAGAMQAADAA